MFEIMMRIVRAVARPFLSDEFRFFLIPIAWGVLGIILIFTYKYLKMHPEVITQMLAARRGDLQPHFPKADLDDTLDQLAKIAEQPLKVEEKKEVEKFLGLTKRQ
jgi:hypothetical protein